VINPDVQLDAGDLNKLTEAVLRFVAACSSSQWSGSDATPELLAAFVRPNDPTIDHLLRVAATKLEAAGRRTGLDGYTSTSKPRVWEMAEAIWAAAVEVRIRYVLPPASF
jgi:hypothetical protein